MLVNFKIRKMILKIPGSRKVVDMVTNAQNKNFYKKLDKQSNNSEKLRKLKNAYSGRCFIVGNGPSLTVEQLDYIKEEYTFGANRIYKVFDKCTWKPNFYVIQDKYDLSGDVYNSLDVQYLLVSDAYWKEHGMNNTNAICFNTRRQTKKGELPFSEEITDYVSVSSTVTYSMIQMACYMGFDEIYLIGMDHKYAVEVNAKNTVIRKNNVKSHVFDEDNKIMVTANIVGMEKGYRRAKEYCDENNIIIKNATIGGYLEIFERVDFYKLF